MFEYKSVIVLGDKGRIVIPEKIRKDLQLEKGDALIIEYNNQDGVIQIIATGEKIQK